MSTSGRRWLAGILGTMSDGSDKPTAVPGGGGLYFFPDRDVTEDGLRQILADGSAEERAEAVSCLLRYAQWEDIWEFISREEVREMFPTLDLPDNLKQAWARILKIEAPVG